MARGSWSTAHGSRLVLLTSILLSLGCGSVGDPLPPLLNIPERSQDLRALQTEAGVVLEWTWPPVTTEGMPLTDIARFAVYGLEWPGRGQPPPPERFERSGRYLAALDGNALEAYGPGDKVRLALPAAPLTGKTFALGVRGESSRSRWVGFSNIVVIQVVPLPAEPGPPSVRSEQDAIVVGWTAGEGATAYAVERSEQQAGLFEERGRAAGNEFRDPAFEWGRPYYYRVRSLARSDTGVAEGPVSEAAEVTPADTFPPARPSGLRAVAAETGVELSWQPNRDADLAGYHVRRALGDGSAELVSEVLLEVPSFSDPNVERGRTYRYLVSALDRWGNESEPSEAIEVPVP